MTLEISRSSSENQENKFSSNFLNSASIYDKTHLFHKKCVNNIRFICAALPQLANSGHPGGAMGCALIAHVLWGCDVLNADPQNPKWWNRDYFILSGGHLSALLYTMLHLLGYDVSKNDLSSFRQLHSKTPGHPEVGVTDGVEVTTGPLGQGFGQAVGIALGYSMLADRYNMTDFPIFDNYVYVLHGDGCYQEGLYSEAASLAGHWKLGRIIAIYDFNEITIDGSTDLSMSDNVSQRLTSLGWHVLSIEDGDNNLTELYKAINFAKMILDKPSLIICKTTIGFGSSHAGSNKTHGAPLGIQEVMEIGKRFDLDRDKSDLIRFDEDVAKYYKDIGANGHGRYCEWLDLYRNYENSFPLLADELQRRFSNNLPENWRDSIPKFDPKEVGSKATRQLSGKTLNALADIIPEIVGGSADLSESNCIILENTTNYSSVDTSGRLLRFGVREHAMAAITNGLFATGFFRPFCATFLNFLGYAWGAVRLGSLSKFGNLYVTTHDSIDLGEDGPTHQPIETIPLLRAMPNLLVARPCDCNEVTAAYEVWLTNTTRPTVMCLGRSPSPSYTITSHQGALQGGYILVDFDPDRLAKLECGCAPVHKVILAGSGTEMQFVIAAKSLIEENSSIVVRIVSMFCWELFEEQPESYRRHVLPKSEKTSSHTLDLLYCEAASIFGWEKYFNLAIGMSEYGKSGPAKDLRKYFGFNAENICETVKKHLCQWDG